MRAIVKGAAGTFELEVPHWPVASLFSFLDEKGGAPALYFEDQRLEDGSSLSDLVRRMDACISDHAATGNKLGGGHCTDTSGGSDAEEIRAMSAPPPGSKQVEALSSVSGAEHQGLSAWVVVGGETAGGISVRDGESVRSRQLAERLATGSQVQELDRRGMRLHYRLIAGSGPAEGWVSTQISGRRLLAPQAPPPVEAPSTLATRKSAAVFFPGEACQYKGMLGTARKLQVVKEMLEKATTILGFDLYELITSGPEFLLAQTRYCQPALFVTSLATFEKLKHKSPEVVAQIGALAGFGVGHYSALCAAGVLTFEAGLKLVKERAEAMQEAQALGKHMVLVVVGLRLVALEALCERAAGEEGVDGVCMIAHCNWEFAYVVCGTRAAILLLKDMAAKAGAQMVRLLNQAVASETPLMRPALGRLSRALREALPEMRPPSRTVWTTTRPRPFHAGTDVLDIVEDLEEHLCSRVDWAPTIRGISAAGARYGIDLSPQGFIKSMSRYIDKGRLKTYSFDLGNPRRMGRLKPGVQSLKPGAHGGC